MSLTDNPVAVPVSARVPLQGRLAGEIAARIAARDIPAAEIVEHFIARLKAVNTRLNAVTVELFDGARKTAAKFDDALLRGEKLAPPAGLPITIKECFDLAGTASTFGLPSRRAVMETEDDPYVAALRAAGAIPIAKTNVPQLPIYTESDNPLYGRTNNPWNVERSCGGSSGGEAALIAAGASPLRPRHQHRGARRRFAARPRQRHRRLAAHSRGLLRHHLDPADCRAHARPLRPRSADRATGDREPGRPHGQARRGSGDGVTHHRARPRSIARTGARTGRPGIGRACPPALRDLHRRRRISGRA